MAFVFALLGQISWFLAPRYEIHSLTAASRSPPPGDHNWRTSGLPTLFARDGAEAWIAGFFSDTKLAVRCSPFWGVSAPPGRLCPDGRAGWAGTSGPLRDLSQPRPAAASGRLEAALTPTSCRNAGTTAQKNRMAAHKHNMSLGSRVG